MNIRRAAIKKCSNQELLEICNKNIQEDNKEE